MEYTLQKTPKGQSRMVKQETLVALVHKTRDEHKYNTTTKVIKKMSNTDPNQIRM